MTQTVESFAGLDALTARDLMSRANGTISASASLRDVVERFMAGHGRHLIVLGDDGRCLGVLGPRHVAQAHRFDTRCDAQIPVQDLGCAPWIAVGPDDDLRTCAQALVEYDLDAIPVLDSERRVLGVVTAHDIARAAADLPKARHPHHED